jgi:hypothetical protein
VTMPNPDRDVERHLAAVGARSLSSLGMARYAAGVAAAALAFGAANVSEAAAALPTGVHVDPNSPAGKQYVIPIVGARSETAGPGSGSSGSSNPPAFGVGITPDVHSGSTSGSGRSSSTSGNSTHHRRHIRRSPSSARSRRQHPLASASAPGGGSGPSSSQLSQIGSTRGPGGSDWLPLGAGGALVLLVGGGGGLALRRRLY